MPPESSSGLSLQSFSAAGQSYEELLLLSSLLVVVVVLFYSLHSFVTYQINCRKAPYMENIFKYQLYLAALFRPGLSKLFSSESYLLQNQFPSSLLLFYIHITDSP